MLCHRALKGCILLYILPCKHFKNVKASKNGTMGPLMHPFSGCQPLSLTTSVMNLLRESIYLWKIG